MTRSAANDAIKTYADLDVSLKETANRIVDDGGKIVFERVGGVSSASAGLVHCSRTRVSGVFRYVIPAHGGDRGAVLHSCFSILRIVARLGSQCSSERDQNWSLGTN
jgi:hypothetical protein